ncbi:MAG: hypothetical protein CMO64_06285 [Verrucomicrobiales bacterium]|nr:hypothetical protein [Verrucomicrobiales bacterium]
MTAAIRPFQPDDLEAIKAITIEGFTGVSVDHAIEKALGTVGDRDWKWRKARHVDEDVTADAAGIFVAEQDGEVVGYISTRMDAEAAKGRIPNLAVTANARGQGIGRALIEHALAHFRTKGMEIAVIETMESNPIGQTLYPSCGFQEIARQIHFAQRL